MIYRILAAAAVLATAAAVPGSTQVRLDASGQFSPPFPISGTWHLSEQLNPAQDNLTPPLANANLTFTGQPDRQRLEFMLLHGEVAESFQAWVEPSPISVKN